MGGRKVGGWNSSDGGAADIACVGTASGMLRDVLAAVQRSAEHQNLLPRLLGTRKSQPASTLFSSQTPFSIPSSTVPFATTFTSVSQTSTHSTSALPPRQRIPRHPASRAPSTLATSTTHSLRVTAF